MPRAALFIKINPDACPVGAWLLSAAQVWGLRSLSFHFPHSSTLFCPSELFLILRMKKQTAHVSFPYIYEQEVYLEKLTFVRGDGRPIARRGRLLHGFPLLPLALTKTSGDVNEHLGLTPGVGDASSNHHIEGHLGNE